MDAYPEIINEIVSNLLGNAMLLPSENGKVEIRISVNKNKDNFRIKVTAIQKCISPEIIPDTIPNDALMHEKEVQMQLLNLTEMRRKLRGCKFSLDYFTESEEPVSQPEGTFVIQVKDILEKNYDNDKFNIDALCSELAVSRSQLYKKFKTNGYSGICGYLKILRLNKARDLLAFSNLNVTQVAFASGFKNLSHFSREFTLKFGKTPKKSQNPSHPNSV
jgi:AraC-like DNA-binding protein